jgi:hypothetical protein
VRLRASRKWLAEGPETLWAAAGLLSAALVYWWLRVIGTAHKSALWKVNIDSFIEHYPMVKFGFAALGSGEVPLWNAYQLCGLPFLAVPHTGLLYPANFIFFFVEAATATEITYILHLFWAGFAMWLLTRRLGLPMSGATASALTFMWSGYMMSYANQSMLIAAMSWLPVTMLLVELTVRGKRFAGLGVVLAIACQVLNGATEVLVHNMYVTGLYAALRLGQMARMGESIAAVRRGALLLGCVVVGISLSAPQLLPSLELASQSGRGASGLTLREALGKGVITPQPFLQQALETTGWVTVGFLPLLGFAVGPPRRLRALWLFGLALAVAAALMVFGGMAFELYHKTLIGDIFRRPVKFLHIYAFAQALMGGLALTRLEDLTPFTRRQLSPRLGWAAILAAIVISPAWAFPGIVPSPYLIAGLALLVAFGAVRSHGRRSAIVIALLALQATNLFFGAKQEFVRPAFRLEAFHQYDDMLGELRRVAGSNRVYLPPVVQLAPGLMQKQGLLNGIRVVGDYESLALGRSGAFFESVAPPFNQTGLFDGRFTLSENSNWALMDLTSTRYYVVPRKSEFGRFLRGRSKLAKEFRLKRKGQVQIYERPNALPRAYFVPAARSLGSPEEILDALQRSGFDPRREVLLEDAPVSAGGTGTLSTRARVDILEDGRERVSIAAQVDQPGYVVLTDTFYPGWKARANGREIPIYRANYLFRAMPVGKGRTHITLEYRPASFRNGLILGGSTTTLLLALALWRLYTREGPVWRSNEN